MSEEKTNAAQAVVNELQWMGEEFEDGPRVVDLSHAEKLFGLVDALRKARPNEDKLSIPCERLWRRLQVAWSEANEALEREEKDQRQCKELRGPDQSVTEAILRYFDVVDEFEPTFRTNPF